MIRHLAVAFLKIFFRNRQALFFVLLLPALLFLIVAFLQLEQVLIFDLAISYTDFLLTGIIAMAIMQTGIYTMTYNLVDLKRTNVLKSLFLTPLPPTKFILAQSFSRFVIGLIQAILLIIAGIIFFQTRIELNLFWLPVLIFTGGSIFLNLGFIIASFVKDYEEAAPYTTIAGLALTFLGDVFFPVDKLPLYLQNISDILPLKSFAVLLRYSILGISQYSSLGNEVVTLIVWLVVTTFIATLLFQKLHLKKS